MNTNHKSQNPKIYNNYKKLIKNIIATKNLQKLFIFMKNNRYHKPL
jgi:hypothetical protein